MFLYLSSQTCRSNTSLPACSFYYCLTLKKNTTEYEAGGSTALMILPKCLLTCGFIFFTCYFCTSFNTEWIFFFVIYLLLLSETPMYMLFGSPGVLRNLLLFGCVFLKLLVWVLASEKASQVLTHGRESHRPLCLCFWEVPWLWGVRSQLPFVNCLNFISFYFILYHFGSLHMSARRGMRAEPFNLR